MKSREITIIKDGIRDSAVIEYEGGKPTLYLLLNNGIQKPIQHWICTTVSAYYEPI